MHGAQPRADAGQLEVIADLEVICRRAGGQRRRLVGDRDLEVFELRRRVALPGRTRPAATTTRAHRVVAAGDGDLDRGRRSVFLLAPQPKGDALAGQLPVHVDDPGKQAPVEACRLHRHDVEQAERHRVEAERQFERRRGAARAVQLHEAQAEVLAISAGCELVPFDLDLGFAPAVGSVSGIVLAWKNGGPLLYVTLTVNWFIQPSRDSASRTVSSLTSPTSAERVVAPPRTFSARRAFPGPRTRANFELIGLAVG